MKHSSIDSVSTDTKTLTSFWNQDNIDKLTRHLLTMQLKESALANTDATANY